MRVKLTSAVLLGLVRAEDIDKITDYDPGTFPSGMQLNTEQFQLYTIDEKPYDGEFLCNRLFSF